MNVNLEHPAENISRQFQEICRHVVSNRAVEAQYRAGYTTITVKSTFSVEHRLPDLLYTIAIKKLERNASA